MLGTSVLCLLSGALCAACGGTDPAPEAVVPRPPDAPIGARAAVDPDAPSTDAGPLTEWLRAHSPHRAVGPVSLAPASGREALWTTDGDAVAGYLGEFALPWRDVVAAVGEAPLPAWAPDEYLLTAVDIDGDGTAEAFLEASWLPGIDAAGRVVRIVCGLVPEPRDPSDGAPATDCVLLADESTGDPPARATVLGAIDLPDGEPSDRALVVQIAESLGGPDLALVEVGVELWRASQDGEAERLVRRDLGARERGDARWSEVVAIGDGPAWHLLVVHHAFVDGVAVDSRAEILRWSEGELVPAQGVGLVAVGGPRDVANAVAEADALATALDVDATVATSPDPNFPVGLVVLGPTTDPSDLVRRASAIREQVRLIGEDLRLTSFWDGRGPAAPPDPTWDGASFATHPVGEETETERTPRDAYWHRRRGAQPAEPRP